MSLDKILENVTAWIKNRVLDSQAQGVVLGLSGGVDSAVLALLSRKAVPSNHLVVIMPCESNEQDTLLAEKLAKVKNLNYIINDLTPTFQILKKTLLVDNNFSQAHQELVLGNLKARLRMSTLYAYAADRELLVLGTDNGPEWFLGYFTKYGDGGVDLLPLVHFLKQDIYQAAKYLDVIPEIIERPPSAGLFLEQTDEADFGFTYEDIDNYLMGKKKMLSEAVITKIETMYFASAHKRQAVPMGPEYQFKFPKVKKGKK